MPRPTRKTKNLMLEAISFVNLIATKNPAASITEKHVRLFNKTAVTFNGSIALGHPIDVDLKVCPQTTKMLTALKKCGSKVLFAENSGETLILQTDKMKVVLECVNPSAFTYIVPDPAQVGIDESFITAIKKVAGIVDEREDRIITSSVCINGQTVEGTDTHVILQAWHGFNLPTNILLPKASVNVLTKINKRPVYFGASDRSITIHFEDGSWFRTQLYMEKYPNVNSLLNIDCNPKPIPRDFFKAIDAVVSFSEDETVYMLDHKVSSHSFEGRGSTHNIGSQAEDELAFYGYTGQAFRAKYLKSVEKYIHSIDFTSHPNACMIFGEGFRGLVGRIK